MSLSRWQKLIAVRMPIAVPPAAAARAGTVAEVLMAANVPQSVAQAHLSYWGP